MSILYIISYSNSPHTFFSLSFHSGLSGKDAFVLYGKGVRAHRQTLSHIWHLDLCSWLLNKHHPPTHTHTFAPGIWHRFQKFLCETLTTLISYWIGTVIFPLHTWENWSSCCSIRLQHTRLPCPSPSPRACSNSCPWSQWCHPIISSSVIPFSCLQSFPASGSFPMSWLFTSDGQSIGASAISPSNEYTGLISFRLYWFDLLAIQGTLMSLLQHHSSKASILWHSEVNVF